MVITGFEVWTVVVPTIPGRVHSQAFGQAGWDEVPKHIVRVNTDDGISGLGVHAGGGAGPAGAGVRAGYGCGGEVSGCLGCDHALCARNDRFWLLCQDKGALCPTQPHRIFSSRGKLGCRYLHQRLQKILVHTPELKFRS